MTDSMKYRFSKELQSHYLNFKTVDLVSDADINLISTRIIYALINSMAMCTDNYQYLQRKYLSELKITDDSKSMVES